jgi:hypothetical protein
VAGGSAAEIGSGAIDGEPNGMTIALRSVIGSFLSPRATHPVIATVRGTSLDTGGAAGGVLVCPKAAAAPEMTKLQSQNVFMAASSVAGQCKGTAREGRKGKEGQEGQSRPTRS